MLFIPLHVCRLLFRHLPLHCWYPPLLSLAPCFHPVLVSPCMISFILMLVTPLLVGEKKKKPLLKLSSMAGLWFEAAHRLRWELYQVVKQLQEWASPSIFFLGHMLTFSVSLFLYPFVQCLLHSSLSTAWYPLFIHCFHPLLTSASNGLSLSCPNFLQSSIFDFQC